MALYPKGQGIESMASLQHGQHLFHGPCMEADTGCISMHGDARLKLLLQFFECGLCVHDIFT